MTKQERIALGHRLRQQRNRMGLTREQFAELAQKMRVVREAVAQ